MREEFFFPLSNCIFVVHGELHTISKSEITADYLIGKRIQFSINFVEIWGEKISKRK